MSDTEYKAIYGYVTDPRSGNILTKPNKSERATKRTILCSNQECPLLAQGQCVLHIPLGPQCPYGHWDCRTGPTGRANSYYEWVHTAKEEVKGLPSLESPPIKIAFVGEYVYLPYAHMTMCKEVPFRQHSSLFVSGIPFLNREHWNVKTVTTLLGFRPQALMGGEIVSYQKESVPLFIEHLRECDPETWQQLIALRPALNKAPNYVGRTALLRTLKSPIAFTVGHRDYPVTWDWDGQFLTTESRHAYNDTWGKLKQKSLSLKMVPEDDATLVVQSNGWVNESTVFVD